MCVLVCVGYLFMCCGRQLLFDVVSVWFVDVCLCVNVVLVWFVLCVLVLVVLFCSLFYCLVLYV